MLGVGGLPLSPPPQAPPGAKPGVSRAPLVGVKTFSLLSNQICKTYFCAFPLPSLASPLSVGRRGVHLFAQSNRKNGGTAVLDSIEGFEEEEDDDEFDFFEDDDEDGDVDDEMDVIVPIEELDEWLKKKPRGFGEGKVYDTSIEDKLVEEIEQTRRAQLANISKLKSLSLETKEQLNKDTEAAVCVRISNLPKKRNIQRDLKTAFKEISGIVNITPSVLGNKKTKDPICKGFAFVNFRSLEDAKRFVDIFSSQNITFGKIDKRIKCELMNRAYSASSKTVNNPNLEGKNKAGSDGKSGRLPLDEEDDSEESWDTDSGDEDDEEFDVSEKFISVSASEDDIEQIEQRMMSSFGLLPSIQRDNPQAAVKVKFSQKESEKTVNNPNVEGKNKTDSDEKSGLLLLDEEDDSEESWDKDYGDEDDEEFDVKQNFKSLSASKLDDIERIEQKMMSSVVLLSSESGDSPQAAVKLKSARKNSEKKNAVAKIPGAPKRLKVQEKAIPTDSGDDEDIQESFKSLRASKDDEDVRESFESSEQKMTPSVAPLPSKHVDKSQAAVKSKSTPKKREKKNTVPKIPGAAKSLKSRDKAMLADVLSRYGSRVASTTKES